MRILHSVGLASSHEYRDLKSPPQNEVILSYCGLLLSNQDNSLESPSALLFLRGIKRHTTRIINPKPPR